MCTRFLRCGLTFVTLSAFLFAGKEFPSGPGDASKPNEYIVRLQDGADPATVLAGLQHTPLLHDNIHLLTNIDSSLPPRLAAGAQVDYVEPNRVRHGTLAPPSDPSYSLQWALQTVRAVQAWNLMPNRYLTSSTLPSGRIRVAVLDTGADCTHPDFMNLGTTSTNSALGGQLNFSLSAAPVATTIAGAACAWQDDHGHGTHTAGIVGAATHNGQGVASLGYPVELLIYKVLDSTGNGTDVDIANAIMRATDAGARVISMSLSGSGYSQTLQTAVNYAWRRNTLVVAAAGNDANNALNFPAGANHAIGVAATDQTNSRASFSNFGNSVDIAAPGVNIISTVPTYTNAFGVTSYAYLSGTSMATPFVSALAGLLATTTPSVAMDAVAQRIQRSANSSIANGGWSQDLGYGIIDAASAMGGTLRNATVGSIVGQVATSSGTGLTATVSASGTINTGTNGLFRFPNLPPGAYTVTASASGFTPHTITVNVVAGADTTVTFAMDVTYAQFTGVVTDRGVAQSGIVVQALSGGLIVASAVTDASGHYSLNVPPGTYNVVASSLSFIQASSAPQTVAAGATLTVNLSISRMGWITGVVRDPTGSPVNGAAISISGGTTTEGATTDATGTYIALGVPAGSYTVTASSGSWPNVSATVTVTADTATTANLQFSSGGGGGGGGFTAIRVNAGGPAYTDPSGNLWSADTGFNGGYTYSTSASIAGTSTPVLYQTEHWFSPTLQYSFNVPNGSYTVNLKFAEIYFTSCGSRIFNIAVNGSAVDANFDPCAAAGGPNKAVDRSYSVTVGGGQIAIVLTGVANNPKISAIEILSGGSSPPPPPPPPSGFTPIRVNAGGGALTDSSGNTWSADTGFLGGYTFSTSASISGTTTPGLYQTERFNAPTLQYTFSVPNATYTVNLKFAEIYFTTSGNRIFNIAINGSTVDANFDPCAAAGGPNRAVDRSYSINVTGGQIAITLTGIANNPKISAIEILSGGSAPPPPPPPTGFSPIRVHAGGGAYTDPSGNAWSADTGFIGGYTYSTSANISGTTTPALYQTERWNSPTLQYAFTVPNGTYSVKLKFAEIFFTTCGNRIFNIAINGSAVTSNFDPCAAAGGPNIAVDRTYSVNVTGGQIAILMTGIANNPKISAIEIQ